LRDLKGPLQSEFDDRPLNTHPRVVLGPPEHGTKRMAGTLGLTLDPSKNNLNTLSGSLTFRV